MNSVKISVLSRLVLIILEKVRFDHFHNFHGNSKFKNFSFENLGSLERGLVDGIDSRTDARVSLENPAVKVGCPPSSNPALQSVAYIYLIA